MSPHKPLHSFTVNVNVLFSLPLLVSFQPTQVLPYRSQHLHKSSLLHFSSGVYSFSKLYADYRFKCPTMVDTWGPSHPIHLLVAVPEAAG
jgi:hypothetical protein